MGTDSLPWEAEEAQFVPPFQVGELLVTSLDGFLTAAALHMGDKLADGRGLERTDPTEAWLALLGASGLLIELAPVLSDEIKLPYQTILAGLLRRYGDAFPDRPVPTPTKRPIGSLRNVLAEAWSKLDPDSEPLMPLEEPTEILPTISNVRQAAPVDEAPLAATDDAKRQALSNTPPAKVGTGPLGAPNTRLSTAGSGELPRLPKLPGTGMLRNTPDSLPKDPSKPQ